MAIVGLINRSHAAAGDIAQDLETTAHELTRQRIHGNHPCASGATTDLPSSSVAHPMGIFKQFLGRVATVLAKDIRGRNMLRSRPSYRRASSTSLAPGVAVSPMRNSASPCTSETSFASPEPRANPPNCLPRTPRGAAPPRDDKAQQRVRTAMLAHVAQWHQRCACASTEATPVERRRIQNRCLSGVAGCPAAHLDGAAASFVFGIAGMSDAIAPDCLRRSTRHSAGR